MLMSILAACGGLGFIGFLSYLIFKMPTATGGVNSRNLLVVLVGAIFIAGLVIFLAPLAQPATTSVAAQPQSTVVTHTHTVAHGKVARQNTSQPQVVAAPANTSSDGLGTLTFVVTFVICAACLVWVLIRSRKLNVNIFAQQQQQPGEVTCTDCGRSGVKIKTYSYTSGKYRAMKRICSGCAKRLGAKLVA
jgi:hypothetical protein